MRGYPETNRRIPRPLPPVPRLPMTITVLGRKVRRGGWGRVTEYLEPGSDISVRTGVQVTLTYLGLDAAAGANGAASWTAEIRFSLQKPNSNRAEAYAMGPTWRKALAAAEGNMLDVFRGLGERLGYEVEL